MYVDPNTVHNPSTGAVAPAAWGDVIRDDLEALADPPQCSVFASVAQTITNNTLTLLTANSENYDTDAIHSTVTNTSRMTINTAGRYSVEACINWQAINLEDIPLLLNFLVDGTTGYNVAQIEALRSSGGLTTAFSGVRSISLAVGQYVEVRVRQVSGFPVDVTLEEFRVKWDSR
jgi:hypothetical protein